MNKALAGSFDIMSGPLYPRHSQRAEDSQVFLVQPVPRFPEPISSIRLSESTKDEVKSTVGNLTNQRFIPQLGNACLNQVLTGDSKDILIEGDASTVIESLSSFRVRGDQKGVRVSLSNLCLGLNLTVGK